MPGMFTNGMPNFAQSGNSDPMPPLSSFPADMQLAAGANPETAAITLGALGYGGAPFALTDGANIAVPLPDQAFAATPVNPNQQVQFQVTLGGNRTLTNPTGIPWNGMELIIYVKQDGTGNRTLAYGNKFKFAGGTPTLSTAANAIDRIRTIYNATDAIFYGVLEKAFA